MFPDLAPERQVVTGNRQQAAWVTLFKARVAGIFFNLTAHATLLTQKVNYCYGMTSWLFQDNRTQIKDEAIKPGSPTSPHRLFQSKQPLRSPTLSLQVILSKVSQFFQRVDA